MKHLSDEILRSVGSRLGELEAVRRGMAACVDAAERTGYWCGLLQAAREFEALAAMQAKTREGRWFVKRATAKLKELKTEWENSTLRKRRLANGGDLGRHINEARPR